MFVNMKSDSLLLKKCCLLAALLSKYVFVNTLKEFECHIVIVYSKTQYAKQNNMQICMLISVNYFLSYRFCCSLELN